MSESKRKMRNWKIGAWGAALVTMLGLFQPASPWLAEKSYDLLFHLRPEIRVESENVAIIYMDDKSHEELGQAGDDLWDRSQHAELIRHLTSYRAKAIVFDIWFDQARSNDLVFLNSITKATNAGIPVLVGATTLDTQESLYVQEQYKAPFEALAGIAAWGWSEKGTEGEILRQHYPGREDERGNFVPSLAWRTAELTLTNKPLDPSAVRWINYYGGQGIIGHRSYADVISNRVPATVFADKVCFVGAFPPQRPPTSQGMRVDIWPTPIGKVPGVDIIATVYLNLLRQDSLTRMPMVLHRILLLSAGFLFGWGLTLFRPITASALGMAGLVVVTAASVWLMRTHYIWFSWLTMVLVQIPVATGWSVLANTIRLSREKVALQTQLVAAQTALKGVATASPEETATRVEGGAWSERAKSAAAQAQQAISRAAGEGQPIIPDHDLVRRVGKGAYGEVWLARNVIGTYHAVKIVKREQFESDEPFEREFRGIQKFMPISRSHPGLVQILHAGRNQQQGYMYYIMEVGDDETSGQEIHPDTYAPKNLAKEIKKRRHLPAEECLQLSLDLTAALDYLHQQHLIHRDIKPANIIFVKGSPKFADIGLVTEIAATGREATFLGTFGYIAPEGPGTPAADVFSLGKVLYETSMGLDVQQYPELPSTMMDRANPQAFFQLNQIILKACQEDRHQRYRSAAEMHSELLKLQTTLRSERTD